MNTLKIFLFDRFKTLSFLTLCIVISIFLLMMRIKLTHSFFLIFLVWNLFLAIVPYSISLYLESRINISKIKLLICSGIWLLFLPNAPYIVTDLIHLQISSSKILLLDAFVILAFAFSGLMLYYLSIIDMLKIFKNRINKRYLNFVLATLFFLSSFGVYLGRFLRYNSWEIIQNPILLFQDIFSILIYPKQHFGAWLFIAGFTVLLMLCYNIFKKLNYFKNDITKN